ncbi:MAG: ABC transporter substrate-binding protein [Trebonia sp.]
MTRMSFFRAGAAAAAAGAAMLVLAACSASSSPPAGARSTGAGSSAPVSLAALVAGSKKESGLLIFSNALSSQMAAVDKAFEKQYPWIHVTAEDDEDPVVFSKYTAEHATGTRTADLLMASAPGLWVSAVKNGLIQPYTPPGLSDFPSFINQGNGLYIFSPDPGITIYNKLLFKGKPVPDTVSQIAADGIAGKYKVATYTISNNFGYSAFYGYVHQKGWAALDQMGKTAATPGDGDVLGEDVAQGAYGAGVFEGGLVRGVIESTSAGKVLGWEYTRDFTPLIPRGIGITAGAANPDSARLYLDFVFSDAGQQALCDAGFEATSNTFTPSDGCVSTLKALYAAVPKANVYMTPFSESVASEQASFTARFRQAFHQ